MQNYHNLRKLARKYRKILHKTRNLCKNVPPYHPSPPFIRQNIWPYQIISVPLHPKTIHRGVEQLVARQAHNLEVACSSPAPATKAWFPQAFFVGSPLHMLPGRSSWTSQAAWPITSTSEAAWPSASPAPQLKPGFSRLFSSTALFTCSQVAVLGQAKRRSRLLRQAKRLSRARVLPPR